MAHYLSRFGAAALRPRQGNGTILPPLIQFQDALALREQFYAAGQPWPFEDIVPGPAKPPAGAAHYLKRQHERAAARAKRLDDIQKALASMPQRISEYKASRRLDWAEVSVVDRLTLTREQIKDKYVTRRLTKTG